MRKLGVIAIVGAVAAGLVLVCAAIVILPTFNGLFGGGRAAIRNGKTEILAVAQFVEVFPRSDHFISYYTGHYGHPTWNSKVGLHGRYVLSLTCEVEFDWTRRHIKSHGPITLQVLEVTQVQGRNIHYNGSYPPPPFDSRGWRRLYEADGDLSVLGIVVKLNQPVPGFDAVWPDA